MKSERKAQILDLLRNSQSYVSGQELCDRLSVSRTAVWKIIGQLKDEGYEIDAVPNKGYRLVSQPEDALGHSELKSRMHTKWAGGKVYYAEETESTNTDAKRLAEEGAPHGTIAVAGMQTAGKGRRGRSWQSPYGTAAYFSIILKPAFGPQKASMLTLVMAMAVADAVEELCEAVPAIKWPNDITINGRKICGILTEMNAEIDYIHYVVIGTGVNVSTRQFPEELPEATSLLLESGRKIARAELIQKVLESFEKYYEVFAAEQSLHSLQKLYNQRLSGLNREVRVLDPQGEFTGISRGVNTAGELLVEREDGRIEAVYAGEVSVRGGSGYV